MTPESIEGQIVRDILGWRWQQRAPEDYFGGQQRCGDNGFWLVSAFPWAQSEDIRPIPGWYCADCLPQKCRPAWLTDFNAANKLAEHLDIGYVLRRIHGLRGRIYYWAALHDSSSPNEEAKGDSPAEALAMLCLACARSKKT